MPDDPIHSMKKLSTAALLCGVAALSSCAAGPHQAQRSLDDFDQKMYIENPWLNGILWGVGVFPVATFGATIADFVVVDAYHFWGKDAWDGILEKQFDYRHRPCNFVEIMPRLDEHLRRK